MRILQIRVLVTRRRGRIRLRGCSLDAPTSEYDNPFSIARATETSEAAARPRTRALAGTNQYVGAGAVAVPADFFRCTEPMGCRWTRQGCGLRSQSSTTFSRRQGGITVSLSLRLASASVPLPVRETSRYGLRRRSVRERWQAPPHAGQLVTPLLHTRHGEGASEVGSSCS